MSKISGARAHTRALLGAVALGSAMGLVLGASYLAGGAARAASDHARAERLAAAAADGFSESSLQGEVAAMQPGALAVARRHDPFTAAGDAQRDRQNTLLASRLERVERKAGKARAARTGANGAVQSAQPFALASADALHSTREFDCLSEAVYYEARGESSAGQAAVAQVVLNRARHPAFPKTVCGVVFQGVRSGGCQFSFACNGARRGRKEPAAWQRAQAVAARALSGSVAAEVGNATHFHVARLGRVWGSRLVQVAHVGSHVFYRFSGKTRTPTYTASDSYAPASELADKPVYATVPKSETVDKAEPELILASAVATPATGTGGPADAPTPPASAPAETAKPAAPQASAEPATPSPAA